MENELIMNDQPKDRQFMEYISEYMCSGAWKTMSIGEFIRHICTPVPVAKGQMSLDL